MQPPLPPRDPPQHPPPPAPTSGTTQQPDRLDALAQRLEQQGGLLASAVTQQSHQLAAQQRLLQDVVQGLLFVGAKAGRPGPAAGSAAATEVAAPTSAAPVVPAPAGRPPRPPARHAAQPCEPAAVAASHDAQLGSPERRRATLAHGLAAHLRQQAGAEPGTAGSSQEQRAVSARQLPCGLLRVPAPPPAGRGALGVLGRRGADLIRPLPCATSAPDRSHHGAAVQGACSRRPAWDDRTVVPPPQHGRRAAAGEGAGSPVPARLVGGLAPQLLLAELQRLQRRRSVGGGISTARRSLQAPLQQANRPLAAPGGMPVQACQLLQQAKEAAADAAAQPLAPQCIITQGTSVAAAEQAAPSSSRPAAIPGGGAMGGQRAAGPNKHRPPQQPVPPTKPAPLDLAALDPAVDPAEQPLPELSDNQMDALCDALLREMLLEECAPCARPPPFPPL